MGLARTIVLSLLYYDCMKVSSQKVAGVWAWRCIFLLLGCILTAVIWEGVFRLFADQKRSTSTITLTKNDQQKYKILTLGESTTAIMQGPAWPEYLEKLLNKQAGSEKFRVINAGVSGTTTQEVSARINEYISQYHPQMVISMLGINDISYPAAPALAQSPYKKALHFVFESRIYRFVSILTRQIVGKKSDELMRSAANCNDASMGEVAFGTLDASKIDNPESVWLTYLSQYPLSYHGYERITDYYAKNNQWEDVLVWTDRAHFMDPYIRFCARQSAQSPDRLQELTRSIDWTFYYISTIENVARNAINRPDSVSTTWYKQFANTLHTPPSDTNKYYLHIAKRLHDEKIVHLAMQYPMLSIQGLQEMLSGVDGIVYVSNEENFQEALKTRDYDEVFVDHFTGVFGHTTEFGSQLIAEQAAKSVIQIVQSR